MSTTVVRRDYKWSEKDWRSQIEETFQTKRRVITNYTVVDGLVLRTSESIYEFSDPEAGKPLDSTVGPPWLFGDGTYREFESETLGLTTVKLTSYDTFSEDSYQVTADAFDPLTGRIDRARFHASGGLPVAATIASGLSRLVRRPLAGTIIIEPSDFVSVKEKVELPWAESFEDMDRAGLRLARRRNSVYREVTIPLNPLLKEGDTLLLVDAARGVNARGIIVSIKHSQEIGGETAVGMEWWPVP